MLTWWADKPVTSQPRNARQPMIAHSFPSHRIAGLHCSFVTSVTARLVALCISYVVGCPPLSPCAGTSTVAYYHMGDKTLLGSLNHVKILSNFVDPCKTTVLHTIRKVSLHFDGISTREYVVIIPSDASQFFHSLTHTYTPASIPSPSPPRSSHGPSPSIPKVSSGLSIMRLCD
jgi:hypothetical protein